MESWALKLGLKHSKETNQSTTKQSKQKGIMADALLYELVKREFQHLMPGLSFDDPTGKTQQKKELEEFLQNAKLSLQSESQDLG